MKIPRFFSYGMVLLGCLRLASLNARADWTFENLMNFDIYTVSDPANRLAVQGTVIYGLEFGQTLTANNNNPTFVYKVSTDGRGYTTFPDFGLTKGFQKGSGLVAAGDTLYGTTTQGDLGDPFSYGTVFSVKTDGSGFNVLNNFAVNGNGLSPTWSPITPQPGIVLCTLGPNPYFPQNGSIFAILTPPAFPFPVASSLYNFTGGSDGVEPDSVVFADGMLYGLATGGGAHGDGTLFALTLGVTDAPLRILHDFGNSATDAVAGYELENVMLSGNTLYGMTLRGGSVGGGTIYKINTDGTGYQILHSFTGDAANDGAYPVGGLAVSGDGSVLFGTTLGGGPFAAGTVFSINTDGSGFTILHQFSGAGDGGVPWSGVTVSGSSLYGTTSQGGAFGNGTVFKMTSRPAVSLRIVENAAVLGWSDHMSGFSPQLGATLHGPFQTVVGVTSPYTNPITSTELYVRLVSNPHPPTVITLMASNVTANSATLDGSILPNGADTAAWFQYGLDTNYGQSTSSNLISLTNESEVVVTSPISGLIPLAGTTYHFQLIGTNSAGTNYGLDEVFNYAPPPGPLTLPASNITSYSATLNGSDTPTGTNTSYFFEYGTDTNYGQVTSQTSLTTSSNLVFLSNSISGLAPFTLYHYQLVVDDDGTQLGGDLTFQTAALPAVVVTYGIQDGESGPDFVSLEMSVNGEGSPAVAYFEYGTNTNYGMTTPNNYTTAPYNNTVFFTNTVYFDGLMTNTFYHFRAVAFNSAPGKSVGDDFTFYTGF
jgi:uncharacterized repeat protein (TIGR03803 family)